jgi:hypothetical protein
LKFSLENLGNGVVLVCREKQIAAMAGLMASNALRNRTIATDNRKKPDEVGRGGCRRA